MSSFLARNPGPENGPRKIRLRPLAPLGHVILAGCMWPENLQSRAQLKAPRCSKATIPAQDSRSNSHRTLHETHRTRKAGYNCALAWHETQHPSHTHDGCRSSYRSSSCCSSRHAGHAGPKFFQKWSRFFAKKWARISGPFSGPLFSSFFNRAHFPAPSSVPIFPENAQNWTAHPPQPKKH